MADITPMDELKAEAVDLAGGDFEDEMADQVDEIGKEVKLTPDGGVIKTISKLGAGWDNPEKGDKVTVHYVGTLESGDKFDSSRDRGEPFSFTLGQGQVIKGWDIGVAKMKKGEVATLKIRGDYGYGEAGSPPKIPSNATLIFEVELLEWASVKDIAGDGGVIKTIVKEGKDYQKPKDRDEVCVRIVARVQGAETSFYSSPEEGEEFELDKGHFCPAIATAVKTMLKGEEVHLIVKPEYGFGGEGRTPDVPPNATLEIDLALLSWKKVEKVWDTDGAVTKKVLVESTEWKTPNADAKVKVSYVARLEDGTVFDERSPDNPLEFTTEEGEVVNGLDLAVMKMKKGEKVLLTIPPEWAFGAEGSQQPLATVPPNATVTYEVTVEDFEKPKETWEMSSEEKVTAAAGLKEKGNKAFKEGQLARAVKKWDRAVEMVNVDTNMDAAAKAAAKDVKKSCNLNLAAAYLKLHETKKAIKVATDVLEADSSNLKALYRRAQAYLATGDFVEAEMDIKAGLVLDEANTDFKLLLRKFKQQQAATAKKEAALYSTMFKKLAKAKETSSAAKQQQQQQAEQPAKQPLSENGAAAVAFAPEAAAAEAGAAEVAPMVTETVV